MLEDVGFDLLNLLVEAFHLLAIARFCARARAGEHGERRERHEPELLQHAHTHLCTNRFW